MKRRRVAVHFAALALVVASCDGVGTPPTTASSDTTDGSSSTTLPAQVPEGIALRWRTRADTTAQTQLLDTVSASIAIGGVTLSHEAATSEGAGYTENLLIELAAGTAPDVFWLPATDVADLAAKGVILDLRDRAEADGSAVHRDGDFYAGPMRHLTFDPEAGLSGRALWGLPSHVSTLALYMNTDLVEEAGITDPRELASNGEWDWDALNEAVAGISDLRFDVRGYGQRPWWGSYAYWIDAAGGSILTDDRTECDLDSTESVAGIAALATLNSTAGAVRASEDAVELFRDGRLGLLLDDRSAVPTIRDVAFGWDVVAVPEGPGGPSNWVFWGAYVVNASTEHPEQAWDLVKALTTVEVQTQLGESGAIIPSRADLTARDIFLRATPPTNNQVFLDGLTGSPAVEGPLWNGHWPEFESVMVAGVEAVLAGERTIEDYRSNICEESADAFGR